MADILKMTAIPTIGKLSDGPIAKNVTEDMSYCSCVPNFMIPSQNAQFYYNCCRPDDIHVRLALRIIIISIAKYFIILVIHGWHDLLNDAW